jgi:hypothetical protein
MPFPPMHVDSVTVLVTGSGVMVTAEEVVMVLVTMELEVLASISPS